MEDNIDLAIEAYVKRFGLAAAQPMRSLCDRDGNMIVLRAGPADVVARYQETTRGLRYLSEARYQERERKWNEKRLFAQFRADLASMTSDLGDTMETLD